MNDEKKYEPAEPIKKEDEDCTDDRIRMQVDDKLIGDDKLIPGLLKPSDKGSEPGKDAIY